jgi:CelD/BcsL family acetyltransferase involved in cellulose biosynthesis
MDRPAFFSPDEIDRDEWRSFIQRAASYPLYAHPDLMEWIVPEGREFLVYTDRVGGEIRTMAVLAQHPVYTLRRMRRLGRLDGWRLVGDRLAGIADEAAHERFAAACVDLLGRRGSDCLFLEVAEVGSPLWEAASAMGSRPHGPSIVYPQAQAEHWLLRFPDPAEDYWKTLTSSRRNSMRRKVKRFEHRVEVVTRVDQVDELLRASSAVAEQSWQGQRLSMGVPTGRRGHTRYATMAELGALRSYVLYHEEQPVAFIFGYQWRDEYHYVRPGYDRRFADQGPGAVLLFRLIEDLIAHRTPAVLDFGYGHADYKERLATEHVMTGPITLNANNLRTRTALTLGRMRDVADGGVRRVLRRAGVYEKVRRAYRRL